MQKLVKRLRKKHAMTQEELAHHLGLSQGLLSRIERGLAPMTVTVALKLKRRVVLSVKDARAVDLFIEGRS